MLVDEVLAALKVRAGGTYIDCTVGHRVSAASIGLDWPREDGTS